MALAEEPTSAATIDRVDDQIKEAVIRQAMEFWINPEIERRRAAGTLPDDFALSAAQPLPPRILRRGAGAGDEHLGAESLAVDVLPDQV